MEGPIKQLYEKDGREFKPIRACDCEGGSGSGSGSLPENVSATATAYEAESVSAEANLDQETGVFSFRFGLARGRDGADGAPGAPGQDGSDGKDGTDGADGNSTEFIYKRTKTADAEAEDMLSAPESVQADDAVPDGWKDNPTGVTAVWQVEWVCKRTKKDNVWSAWSTPAIWSKWGVEGKDGDGIEYIYLRNDGIVPANPTPKDADGNFDISSDEYQGVGDYENKEYVPTDDGWTDNPKGVTLADQYEWVCVRKYKYNSTTGTKQWTAFSDPALWAKYGAQGEQGPQGPAGPQGQSGESTVTMRTVFAFKTYVPTEEAPECPYPVGGSWDITTNEITYPEGWSATDEVTAPVWMSTGDFIRDAPDNPTWSKPVCISGKDGANGVDGTTTEYVYLLTENDLSVPATPTENNNITGDVPNESLGWTASPTGISESMRAEWVSTRKKDADGNWGNWGTPTLWSKWGANGMDGDGVQYIFLRNSGASLPNPTPDGYLTDDKYQEKNAEYLPTVEDENGNEYTWTDEPTGVTATITHEWVCIRKYRYNETYKKMMWGAYSDPALWAKYGDPGYNGLSIRTMYRTTPGSDKAPVGMIQAESSSTTEDYVFITDNINPGSDWSIKLPTDVEYPTAIWSISAYINYKNELVEIETDEGETIYGWQGPTLVSGLKGADGISPNWKITVFKLKASKPNAPSFNTVPNSYPTEDGWKDFIDGQSQDEDSTQTTQWWQCIGVVNGEDNTITWGTVLNVNGQDGTAQDGKHWEVRFRASATYDTAPDYSAKQRDPNVGIAEIPEENASWDKGWVVPSSTTPAPTAPEGGVVWETMAEITPDDLLVDGWCMPFRVAGERGPQGNTGPAGPTGPSGPTGIPGTRFELRYCIGTYDAPHTTDTDYTNSDAWLEFVPSTTGDNPYIWCVQGKKVYADANDTTGTITWGEPFKLNGLDGNDAKGIGISSVDEYYLVSEKASGVTTSTSGWKKNEIPAFTDDDIYLWNYEVINYTDGSKGDPTTPAIIGRWGRDGNDGQAGANGVSISSTTVQYALSNSATTTPSSWSNDPPTLVQGKYLWTKFTWTYSNNTSETGYTKSYIAKDGSDGNDGDPGKDGTSIINTVVEYTTSDDGTTPPTSGWDTQVPSVPGGTYLWTRMTWTYSDNTTEYGYSVSKNGVGITSITEYYLASAYSVKKSGSTTYISSSGSLDGSSWSTDSPTTSDAKPYLWNKEVIVYDNGTTDEFISFIGASKSGADGKRGQLVYPAGIYSESITYVCDENKAPYVMYNGDFYVLNTQMSWTGTSQSATPATSTAWLKFDSFEAIYADILVAKFGLVGSAVFYEEYMFSQQGITSTGAATDAYENFYYADPYGSSATSFRPNWCVNFKTGEQWLSGGRVHFAKDGSGYLADGSIAWDSAGIITKMPAGKAATINAVWTTTSATSANVSISLSEGYTGTVEGTVELYDPDGNYGTAGAVIGTWTYDLTGGITDKTITNSKTGATTISLWIRLTIDGVVVAKSPVSAPGGGTTVEVPKTKVSIKTSGAYCDNWMVQPGTSNGQSATLDGFDITFPTGYALTGAAMGFQNAPTATGSDVGVPTAKQITRTYLVSCTTGVTITSVNAGTQTVTKLDDNQYSVELDWYNTICVVGFNVAANTSSPYILLSEV